MKRGRGSTKLSGGSATGGTGDVKPQYMTLNGAIPAAVDDYMVDVFSIPVVRPGSTGDNATIMEILSLDWYLNLNNLGDAAGVQHAFITPNPARTSGDTCTVASISEDAVDPRTQGLAILDTTLTTSGSTTVQYPIHIDMTDGNGNGNLWALDTITMVAGQVNNAVAGRTVCKLKYRWVRVGLIEYLGIVQQQGQ